MIIAECMRTGDYTSSEYLVKKAIVAAKQQGNTYAEATSYSFLASLIYKQGNPSRAETISLHALTLMCRTQDLLGIARVTFILAQIAYSKSDFQEAIALFKKCIHLYEKARDTSNVLQGFSELSAVYIALGLYPRARKLLEFLLTQSRRLQGKEMTFITYDYADLSIMTGELETARSMLEKCRRLSRNQGFRPMEAAALALQGKVEEFSGTPKKAIALMVESIEIQDSIHNKEILMDVLCHLSHLYTVVRDFENANGALVRSRKVAEEDGHDRLIAQCDLYEIEYRLQKRELADLGITIDDVFSRITDLEDPTMMNLIRLNRIEYLVLCEDYQNAEEEIETLLQNARDEDAKLTEFQGLVVKAALKTKRAEFDEADSILEECLQESKARGLTPFLKDASNLKERIAILKATVSLYDHADTISENDSEKQQITSEEVAAYISRAKSVIASMES